MKDKNILIAFILNVVFSIFEIIGGLITNSVAIISDAVHDAGDALSIGISYFLERKSKNKPDDKYTYGYLRYSVLGAFITTSILLVGSVFVIYSAVLRIINPIKVNYNGMIIFAVFGVIINFIAAYVTREKDSINQRAVNLHMLEDVLGWVVVLIGSIVIKYTKVSIIDSVMSIFVSLFILYNAICNMKYIVDLFLEKIPSNISIDELKKHICELKGVVSVHHVHVWSIDGYSNYATMHVVYDGEDTCEVKKNIREEMSEHGISHVTIEIEGSEEKCDSLECSVKSVHSKHHHHHH